MTSFKMISVIIPALNEQENVVRCIEAIENTILPNSMAREIVLVDNGSTDRTVTLAQKTTAKIIIRKEITIGALRNVGVTQSQGDLVAFVDADCVVSPQWLAQAVACLEREAAAAVGSHHLLPPGAGWLAKTAEIVQRDKIGGRVTYIPSGNLIVVRQAFCAVGGFDESLETNEDVDLCWRLRRSGFAVFADPQIMATHFGYPKSIGKMIRREMWHGQNTTTLFFRELKKMVNLPVVLFSAIYLSLLGGLIVSTVLLFRGDFTPLAICGGAFVCLIVVAALKKCGGELVNLPRITFYVVVYGLGRAMGLCQSVLCKIFT